MKVLIWFLCIFANALITTLIKEVGIIWGAIPTVILYGATFWLARTLCKKWDEHKESKAVEQNVPVQAVQTAPADITEQVRFCRKCGEKLIDESRFCRKCGAEVATVTTVTVSESDSSETNTFYVFNNAYSKIIGYIDGTPDCLVDNIKLNYIYDCLYLCSAWCVFHANKDKKEQVESLRQRLLQKADELNLPVEKITDDYDSFNAHMLNYKKEVIDPEYVKDSSVENYNKLIEVYLAEVLSITEIKLYPKLTDDFLSCMK